MTGTTELPFCRRLSRSGLFLLFLPLYLFTDFMKRINFIVRTLTGVLFVALVLGSIFYGPVAYTALFLLVACLTSRELAGLLEAHAECHMNRNMHALMTFFIVAGSAAWANETLSVFFAPCFALFFVLLLTVMLDEIRHNRADSMNSIFYQIFVQAYVSVPFSLLITLPYSVGGFHNQVYSWHAPLALFLMLWASDTGAYCVGSLIGKHKLAPAVSPGKTWEGSLGGLLTTVCVGLLMAFYFPFQELDSMTGSLAWVALAILVCVAGTMGDLVESLIKRHLGIKDSGNVLPGHGGLLDRFDSMLFAAPLAFLFFLLLGTCCNF